MNIKHIKKFWFSVYGYFVSVLTAALIATIALLNFLFLNQGAGIEDLEMIRFFMLGLFFTSLIIGVTAWPGYIFTLYFAKRHNTHSYEYYSLMGMFNGLVLVVIFILLEGGFKASLHFFLIPISMVSGAVGGFSFYKLREYVLS